MLAGVKDVFNGVLLKGNAVGDVFLYGRGAGKLPTASAVVADILDAAKHFEFLKGWGWQDEKEGAVMPMDEVETAYFVRFKGISEDALRAYPRALMVYRKDDITAIITPKMKESEHVGKLAKLNVLSAIRVL
jgi:homoserine dehydrogenase